MSKRRRQRSGPALPEADRTAGESIRDGFIRGLAAFLGGFSLLNLLGNLLRPGYDANIWWIDFRFLSPVVGNICLVAAAILLTLYACLPGMSRWRKDLTVLMTMALAAVVARNTVSFYKLLHRGEIQAGVPFPFSLLVLMSLLVLVPTMLARPRKGRRRLEWLSIAGTIVVCMFLFPLAQMICFGKTDYRRQADAVVVFGARTYADGTPSAALADRVRTACRLYLDGLAPIVIMSGGPGDGPVHETEAMRKMAVSLGVPDKAIVLDADGINTRATIRNTIAVFDRLKIRRAIVVSHFYHLPRIKMCYQQQAREVYSVPAKESCTLTRMPYYIVREIVALWKYYLEPLARQ
ncbi:MAG: YdcF family protein [Phycisphaerae bacterium]